jgi:hypothetical protein
MSDAWPPAPPDGSAGKVHGLGYRLSPRKPRLVFIQPQLTVNHDGRVRERVPVPWFSCRAVRDSPSARNILLSTKGSGSSPPAKMREAIDEACPTTIVCTGVCTNCICEKWISSLSSAEMSNAAIDVFSPSLPHRVIDRKTGSDAPPWRVDVERDGRRRFRLEEEHLRDDDRRERIVNLH